MSVSQLMYVHNWRTINLPLRSALNALPILPRANTFTSARWSRTVRDRKTFPPITTLSQEKYNFPIRFDNLISERRVAVLEVDLWEGRVGTRRDLSLVSLASPLSRLEIRIEIVRF